MYILSMVAVTSLLLFLSFANPSQTASQHPQETFEQLAKQADEARTSNHLNGAIQLYSLGVHMRPAWSEGWWWLGSLLYDQDRFPEAQAAFARFVKLSTRPGPAYAFLALCEYENREYDSALQHFQAWSKNGSPGSDALLDVAGFHWALLLTRKGQFQQALYLLAAKARKLGAAPALVEALGLPSLRMANLPEDYPSDKREAIWLAGMAAYFSVQDEFRRSNEYAQRLVVRYGQAPNVHYLRGTLLRFQGDWRAAAQEFEKELQISPTHAPALVELAMLSLDASQAADALTPAKRAVVLDPNNAKAHYALGRALLETGSYQESANELEIAKRLSPDSARVRFVLSSAYRHLGRLGDSNREQAAFEALQGKEEVLAPLDEKLKSGPKPDAPQ